MKCKAVSLIIVLCLSNFFSKAQSIVITTTSQLSSENIKDEIAFVKDSQAGGTFYHSDDTMTVDNGVVFKRREGGFWIRHVDKAQGVNPCWWGAKGDGVHDDLPAINSATAYCLKNETVMQFPSGVFRITGQWLIGGKSLEEDDLFEGKITKNKTFKMSQHQIARQTSPLIVRGGIKTCIYGDFIAEKLTAIIYYNVKSNGISDKPSTHLYTHEFSNIGIYGKGCFRENKPVQPSAVDMQNQQIGLAVVYCNNAKISGCSYIGLKYGLVFKTAYWNNSSNLNFEYCQTGLFTSDFNANLFDNIVGHFCKLLADINGSQIVFNNLNSENCETTLWFKGKNAVLNGVYCENGNTNQASNYHLIFGQSQKDAGGNKLMTTGVVINGLTLTAGGRDVILLNDNMQQLTINGANINGNIVTKKASNKINSSSATGNYKIIGEGRQQKLDDKQN